MSAQVLVVGSANVDLTTTVERLPAAGETVIGGALGRGVGGKGVNQAIAACRAGARVELRAAIGADEPGNWLLERVRGEGVCVDRVQRPASRTGTALVVVDGSGENQIVVCPGANAVASPRFASRALGRPAVVLAQCEIQIPTVLAALRGGRRAGAVTILNGSPVVRLPAGIGDLVDVLVVNEHEYTGFFGRRFSTATGPHSGWRTVVVTLGSRGAAIADAAGTRCVPAPSVRAVDTVGAGDAFCGVLAATLAAGGSIDTAVTRACVAGALAATRRGAASAPTAAELERGTAAPLEPHVSP